MGFFSRLFGGGGVQFQRRYSETRQTPAGACTFHYEVYTAKTAQQAREFLNGQTVTAPYTYVVVETPEGNWGKDKEGIYKEGA